MGNTIKRDESPYQKEPRVHLLDFKSWLRVEYSQYLTKYSAKSSVKLYLLLLYTGSRIGWQADPESDWNHLWMSCKNKEQHLTTHLMLMYFSMI